MITITTYQRYINKKINKDQLLMIFLEETHSVLIKILIFIKEMENPKYSSRHKF